MAQTFRTDLPRVRQLTADEATVLVWRNDGAAAIVTGRGRPGHAAIMLRSDHLPIVSQDDIKKQETQMKTLGENSSTHAPSSCCARTTARPKKSRSRNLELPAARSASSC
ncbi:MAG TPA: hypothetical protein VFE61_32255 [Candidatus Sulfotelmatobacter sp.]|jgi:hypothetical protein|nr:hypothetical protein [Candidatus Sulfotelmatobacter sp.]